MTVAFNYRPRKATGPFNAAFIGSTVTFDERTEYVLVFPAGCSPKIAQRVSDFGGEFVRDDTAVLAFDNFVGRTDLAGVGINVLSIKIGEAGVSRILQEISEISSSLVFGWRSPTGFESSLDQSHRAPVPYHQLQRLRRTMIGARPGQRLQDWVGTIARNPTRRFEPDRPLVAPDRLKRLDHRSVNSIFSRLERLVPMPIVSPLAANPLAQALTFGTPPTAHFPSKIEVPQGRLSVDTLENRFVKHVLCECLALVFRFVDHPKIHSELREDCRTMLGVLSALNDLDFVSEAGKLTGFHAPSQALAKLDGYRDVFTFWSELTRHVSLPRSAAETTRLLEGRDMATLYEYWVFLKIVETAVHLTGGTAVHHPKMTRNELGETLTLGLKTAVGENITIRFNPSFMRSTKTAYSTPLRPDVTVAIGHTIHGFDAKYRLDRFESEENDSDDGAATYKRSDLYKMHTYRDAIMGMRTAFVVYPGSEFVFFERSGNKRTSSSSIVIADGVGAVPLRPADVNPTASLRALLRALITSELISPLVS